MRGIQGIHSRLLRPSPPHTPQQYISDSDNVVYIWENSAPYHSLTYCAHILTFMFSFSLLCSKWKVPPILAVLRCVNIPHFINHSTEDSWVHSFGLLWVSLEGLLAEHTRRSGSARSQICIFEALENSTSFPKQLCQTSSLHWQCVIPCPYHPYSQLVIVAILFFKLFTLKIFI